MDPTQSVTTLETPRIEVLCAGDSHVPALAEFYRAVWDPEATTEGVRAARAKAAAANPFEPGRCSPCFLFMRDGEAIGHIGSIPAKFWNGTSEHRASWFNGFMVLPEHRNGPVGYAVLKEALRDAALSAVLTVAPPSKRLFGAMGFVDRGPVPNYLLILRPGAVLAAVDVDALGLRGAVPRLVRLARRLGFAHLSFLAQFGLALWKAIGGRGCRGATFSVGLGSATPDEITGLWRRVREQIGAAHVRDAAYLRWRFASSDHDLYEIVMVRERGSLVALAVVRPPRDQGDERLRGIRVATLTDILFAPDRPDVGITTVGAAERIARRLGADALLCTASHRALSAVLQRRGFLRFAGNAHFMMRDTLKQRGWPASLSEWWITRGDAEADGNL